MGTRSFIGFVNPDNTATAVYCHWDGYPSNNGKILLQNYETHEKVSQLLSFGNISSLGEEIGTKHDFDKRPEGKCTFYNRDRNEEWNSIKPKTYSNVAEFLQKCDEEYTYLFRDNKWYFRGGNDELQELTIEKCVD
jgi:hypothetical protein